jgi:CheY-like chemotaxis protein
LGYKVRSAEDGFSALVEMRNDIPDIILSDLNMPGMSGFELLSIVRLRFPAIPIIAMSGAYSGDSVPPEVVADAFYEKGTNLAALLQVVETLSPPGRPQLVHHHNPLAPILIPWTGQDLTGEPHPMITCPECLGTFTHVLDEADLPDQET